MSTAAPPRPITAANDAPIRPLTSNHIHIPSSPEPPTTVSVVILHHGGELLNGPGFADLAPTMVCADTVEVEVLSGFVPLEVYVTGPSPAFATSESWRQARCLVSASDDTLTIWHRSHPCLVHLGTDGTTRDGAAPETIAAARNLGWPVSTFERVLERIQEAALTSNVALTPHDLATAIYAALCWSHQPLQAPVNGLTAHAMAISPQVNARATAAAAPDLATSAQLGLASDPSRLVRRTLAANPATAPEVLDVLASSAELDVRRAVIANPSTTPDTRNQLTQTRPTKVRKTRPVAVGE